MVDADFKENSDVVIFPGVETGVLNVSSSSIFAPDHSVERCLINFEYREGSGSWGPATNDLNQYIQFSSALPHYFHRISTKGQVNGDNWVKSFLISYTLDGNTWTSYENGQILEGNTDKSTISVKNLVPFFARAVRIKPLNWNGQIRMRVELYISSASPGFSAINILIPAIELGMTVKVSSIWDSSHDQSRIRLNFCHNREGGRSWSAASSDLNQWVLVSTVIPKKWCKISTQGRADGNWVKEYYLSYTSNGRDWHVYNQAKLFTANTDGNSIVTHDLVPFQAISIKIHPISWNVHISMRLEMYFQDI